MYKDMDLTLGKIIREKRLRLGLTQKDVAEYVGVSMSAVSRWESGEIGNMGVDRVPRLAAVLEMSHLDFINPAKHVELRQPTPYNTHSIPLLGTIAAGTPILAEENITEYFNLDSSIRADFALRVRGDSMIEAGIFPDDIAFFRHQSCLDNGQVGAVLIDNEATLKTFYKTNDSIILQPANKKYPPIILTEDIRVLGLLVAVLNRKDV